MAFKIKLIISSFVFETHCKVKKQKYFLGIFIYGNISAVAMAFILYGSGIEILIVTIVIGCIAFQKYLNPKTFISKKRSFSFNDNKIKN